MSVLQRPASAAVGVVARRRRPPVMPAAKLRPVAPEHDHRRRPSCTRSRGRRRPRPPRCAPELRTAKRSPASPQEERLARRSPRRARCCRRSRCRCGDVAGVRRRRGRRARRRRAPCRRSRCARPSSSSVEPARRATPPRLWPARPAQRAARIGAVGQPGGARARRAISPASIAPTLRSVLRTWAREHDGLAGVSSAAPARGDAARASSAAAEPVPPAAAERRAAGAGRRLTPAAAPDRDPRAPAATLVRRWRSRSARPITSSKRATPSAASQLAHLLGDEQEVAHDVLGRAGEAPPQLGVLRRDPDRAGVEVADAHHHAAGRDQRRGREGELLGAEQRRRRARRGRCAGRRRPAARTRPRSPFRTSTCWVSASPSSHGQAGVLERRQRRGAGAAVVAGDHDVVGARPWRRRPRSCRRRPRRRA